MHVYNTRSALNKLHCCTLHILTLTKCTKCLLVKCAI